jgi:hypothetical protein
MAVTLNASTTTGLVQSADTSGIIQLQSNGTTALTVNTNEGVQILNCLGVGNATPSTSGAGITFPATQSASTDANTLDDYEEGTWTPTFNANLTAAAAYAKGRYVKIGSMVWVTYSFRVGTVSGANDVEFGGLPFVNIANTADTSSDTFLFTAYSGGPTVGDRGAGGYISGGSSTIVMYDLNNNANVTNMTNGDLAVNDFIWVSGWYRTS